MQSYYFPPNVLTLQGINCGRAGCMLLRPGDPAPRAVCALHDGGKTNRIMEDRRLEATARLLDVMTTLRRECPWDREQTFDSLRSNTIEETYELADAITDHNMEGSRRSWVTCCCMWCSTPNWVRKPGRSTMRMWPTPCATNWYTAIRTFTATSMPIRPTK